MNLYTTLYFILFSYKFKLFFSVVIYIYIIYARSTFLNTVFLVPVLAKTPEIIPLHLVSSISGVIVNCGCIFSDLLYDLLRYDLHHYDFLHYDLLNYDLLNYDLLNYNLINHDLLNTDWFTHTLPMLG